MSKHLSARIPSSEHNNADLLVWACFCAGGAERWIDVEDLYLKAFELGPSRLGWRTRPDLPDYKKCAKALQEIEDPKRSTHINLFLKNGRYQRKLTLAGMEWCQMHHELLARLYGEGLVPAQGTSHKGKALAHARNSRSYHHFIESGRVETPRWELAEALQCMPDSSSAIWLSRLDILRIAASECGDQRLLQFEKQVRDLINSDNRGANQ